jgi:hypothetical protein
MVYASRMWLTWLGVGIGLLIVYAMRGGDSWHFAPWLIVLFIKPLVLFAYFLFVWFCEKLAGYLPERLRRVLLRKI